MYVCSQCELWERPIILIGHSFGGLVIKSLVVEVGKRTSAPTKNDFDIKTKRNCTRFLETFQE
jgi:triacylglycerol esterase/lipase EstA (alpha/beta hydrolase family)